MAHETVTKSKRFYCISLTPDICKTPMGNSTPPIPYTVIGEFSQAQSVSPNVKTQSEPVILHNKSFIPTVKGDAPGSAGGVKSGTVGKRVETKESSSTKGSNGKQTVQESRVVWMNDRNTIGRIYERGVQAARSRLDQLAEEAHASLKEAAQDYKDNVSPSLHQFGEDAMETGGNILLGSGTIGGAGLVVGSTGVGLPVAAAMETTAAAGGVIGGAVTTTGAVADTGATLLDKAADYILSGKTPDIVGTAENIATNLAQNVVFKKISTGFGFVKKVAKKVFPGDKPKPGKKPPEKKPADSNDGKDGGKTKKKKEEKSDKPSDCCPKNGAPGGKPTKSKHPVHFGTGEEILHQTDFVLDGTIPLEWTRCYRSGSESEDWGLLGARWATPFTSSLSVCARGIVYHEDSGRALRLPAIATGQEHDHRGEGFTLRRDSDTQFTLIWRDGSTDTFLRGPDGVLPHGYDGVNAMLAPRTPLRAERYYLARSAGRDGRGIRIERRHEAQPGEVLLRLTTDDGLTVEAIRDDLPPAMHAQAEHAEPPRIGRIEEVRADGSRICHVSYLYAVESRLENTSSDLQPDNAFSALPQRYNLVEQSNLIGEKRTYTYRHHLLTGYTTYSGFAHGLEWVSLSFLRERWAGSPLNDAQLAERHPITLANSYQARAVRTLTADGNDEIAIAYIDADTTRVTEADGGILEYRFNANWLVTEVRRISPDGGAPRSLGRREWDADGMLLADIDAEGNATRYTYDDAGNLATITDARHHTTRIDYDSHHQPVAVTDALGHTTRRAFDEAGRIVESTDALGRTTRYTYDAGGRLAVLTDARGGTKRLSYDAAGRLIAYTDCSSHTTQYQYDEQGRLIDSTDAVGNRTGYRYDALGRLVAVTHPDQTGESFDYDSEGNLVRHVDAKGQVTQYRYNGHGLPVERIDAKGQTLQYRYDKALRLIELVNGNGESYRFTYDVESRLASETGFDGKTTTYAYDSAGQLIASDSNGQRTDYIRDALGLLLARSNADGSVRYAYDALGRLTAVASAQAQQRFIHDAAGQLVEERMAYALTSSGMPGQSSRTAAFTLTHAYDVLGNRIQTTLPNGRRVDTLRYGSGHWHGTLWQGTPLVDLERDHLHRETVRQIGTGRERLTATRSYDPQSRLQAMTLERGLHRLRERRYAYDTAGNLTRIEDAQRGNTVYAYDPLGQLLSAVQPDLSETFAFDPAGNLLDAHPAQPARPPVDLDSLERLTDQSNQTIATGAPQLARVTRNLLQHYLGYTYDYDAQGNTIVKRLRPVPSANDAALLDLAYDAENRLSTATRRFNNARQVARYHYDAFGRRIAKQVTEEQWKDGETVPQTSMTQTTWFVWDGDVLAQEIHSDKTITYLYEPDSFVPLARIESARGASAYANAEVHLSEVADWNAPRRKDEPAAHVSAWRAHQHIGQEQRHQEAWRLQQEQAEADATGDRIHYYHCDHLGTPLELTDEHGKTVWAARYRAWGRILRHEVKEVEQPLRFQGQYEDAETGLYYNRYRYYDPDSARYVTQDPIGLLGGENSYQYAPNSTAWIDPRGLAKTKGGCDPCCGRDPATAARKWQGPDNEPYYGVDNYTNTIVKKGTVLYTLYPHGNQPGNYFSKSPTVLSSSNAHGFNESLQVAHKGNWDSPRAREMRTQVHAYVVAKDTCMAVGQARNNTQLGVGGGTQYFIENVDKKNLIDTGRIIGLKK